MNEAQVETPEQRKARIREMASKLMAEPSPYNFNGMFRDTGREANNPGEFLDSVIGAPVRTAISEAQDGNFDLDALKKVVSAVAADPKNAPTGKEIVAKAGVSTKPASEYLGSFYRDPKTEPEEAFDFRPEKGGALDISPAGAAGLGVDFAAQLPVGMLAKLGDALPGIAGTIKGVKESGNLADASELFAKRGASEMSAEAKLKNLHGVDEPRDIVPELTDRAYEEMKAEKLQKESAEKLEIQRTKSADSRRANKLAREIDENIIPNINDDGADHLRRLQLRFSDEPRQKLALNQGIINSHESNSPYTTKDVNGFDRIPLPNFSAKPTGQIGFDGINVSHSNSTENLDPFMWMDQKYGASKTLMLKHKSLGMPADIHTSSDLIAHDDYISAIPKGSVVNIHLQSPDDELNRILFPGNASNKRLLGAAEKLKGSGIKVNVIEPTVEDIISAAKDGNAKHGFTDSALKRILTDKGVLTEAQKESGAIPIKRGPQSVEGGISGAVNPAAAGVSAAQNDFDPDKYLAEKTGQAPAFDPDKYLAEKTGAPIAEKSWPEWAVDTASDIGHGALNGLAWAGKQVDRVGGAPTRSAIGAIQDGNNPFTAFGHQFGRDPEEAPTGKDLVAKAGVSTKPISDFLPESFFPPAGEHINTPFNKGGALDVSPAGALGLGVDLAADPLLMTPVGKIAKVLGGVGLEGVKLGARGAAKTADFLASTEKASKGLDVLGSTVNDAKKTLSTIFSPKVAGDFPDMVRIAKENGIDPSLLPEAVEFGDNQFITRAARNRAEGPIGQNHLQKFQDGLDQVQEAATNKIKQIAGGPPPDPVEAGEIIRKGFNDGVKSFMEQEQATYKSVMQVFPGMQMSPEALESIESKINGIEKFAKGRLERGIAGKEEAQHLLDTVQALRNTNGSYKQMAEALSDIGELAFKSKNPFDKLSHDVVKLRDLYGTISEGMIDTVRKTENLPKSAIKNGAIPIADQLVENNQKMHAFFGDKSLLQGVIGDSGKAPEKIFQNLIMNGDTTRIQALKNIVSPEQFQQLKGAFLENLVKRDPDGAFTFKTLFNAMRNKRAVMGALFEPEEIKQFGEIVKLGDRFGNPVLSSSGTGASNMFRDVTHSLKSSIANDQVIESLKDTARQAAQAPQVQQIPQLVQGAIQQTPATPAAESFLSRVFPEKTGASKVLKAGQTISPSYYAKPQQQVVNVPPEQRGQAQDQILNNNKLNSIEKAKQMKLLTTQGKAVIGE